MCTFSRRFMLFRVTDHSGTACKLVSLSLLVRRANVSAGSSIHSRIFRLATLTYICTTDTDVAASDATHQTPDALGQVSSLLALSDTPARHTADMVQSMQWSQLTQCCCCDQSMTAICCDHPCVKAKEQYVYGRYFAVL